MSAADPLSHHRVLVTGANGLVGRTVLQHLRARGAGYVIGCDRSPSPSERLEGVTGAPVPPEPAVVVFDITDADHLRTTMIEHDITTVVHCAADPRGDAPFESTLHTNVLGARVVIRTCAELEKVKRVVFFSSLMVSWGYWLNDQPFVSIREQKWDQVTLPLSHIITHESPVRPTCDYAASKLWTEALARGACENEGLSVLCIRLGAVNAEDNAMDPGWGAIWCSRLDLAVLVEKCVVAGADIKFDIFYAVSNSPYRWVDVSHAKDVVGWEPVSVPEYREGVKESIR